MAPYRTIARGLSKKAQVTCVRSKETSVFSIFYDVHMGTKSKMTVNFLAFPWVNFCKILVNI